MKTRLLSTMAAMLLTFTTNVSFAQAPNLGSTSTFALFTINGAFTNVGDATTVTGNVGNTVGGFTVFPTGTLIGQKHAADEVATIAATDLTAAYNDLLVLNCGETIGITLGNEQVLTPNIYCLGSGTVINGNLILDGQGNANSVFIFKINGALNTNALSKVQLTNSANLNNIYWQIGGAMTLGSNSVFRGTALVDGAITLLDGASLLGRGLTKAGAISLNNNVVSIPTHVATGTNTAEAKKTITVGPNPFSSYSKIVLNDVSKINTYIFKLYNVLGKEIMNTPISKQSTTIDMSSVNSGIYFYKVMDNDKIVQSGKLISKK
ncbi:MAG: ice-binding family protein [Paludibacter sp.]